MIHSLVVIYLEINGGDDSPRSIYVWCGESENPDHLAPSVPILETMLNNRFPAIDWQVQVYPNRNDDQRKIAKSYAEPLTLSDISFTMERIADIVEDYETTVLNTTLFLSIT